MALPEHDIADAPCRDLAGKPASSCDWRELLRVRDVVGEALNAAVNERQLNSASTSPDRPTLQPGATGTKAVSASLTEAPRHDPPAPTCPRLGAPRRGAGSTTTETRTDDEA